MSWSASIFVYHTTIAWNILSRVLDLDTCDQWGDKTIPDEASPSLESFYPPWVAGIDLPQSMCRGYFLSFIINILNRIKTTAMPGWLITLSSPK